MADLAYLRESGLEAKILRFADQGGAVFGICGGYQMLGRTLSDPAGAETGGSMRGMGLLPVETLFASDKTRTRTKGRFGKVEGIFSGLSGKTFEGYEIHMGTTESPAPILGLTDSVSGESRMDGCAQGNVYGTYVHGILDGEDTAGEIIAALARKKGVDPSELGSVSGAEYKQRQYDLLADTVRANMDMEAVYRIFEEGIA